MTTASIIELPDRWTAAAASPAGVWCAAGRRLLAFDEAGGRRLEVPLSDEVTCLAAASRWLVAVQPAGTLAWLNADDGTVRATQPAGRSTALISGGGAVWALDRDAGRAWRADEPGAPRDLRLLPDVDQAASDGERLWWTSTRDAWLRDGERAVDLGAALRRGRGGLAVCVGSVWMGVAGGLCRVGTWGGELGPLVKGLEDAVPFLACAGGVLVGAATRDRLIALDPSADADVRVLDVETGGEVGALVATGRTAWVFPRGRSEVRLVPV